MRGQLSEFINPVKGLSFFRYEAAFSLRYEEISQCQSKSVWLKKNSSAYLMWMKWGMRRRWIENWEKCQQKDLKKWSRTKYLKASKNISWNLPLISNDGIRRAESVSRNAKSQKFSFMRNSRVWTLIKRNEMKNHLELLVNAAMRPQWNKYFMNY